MLEKLVSEGNGSIFIESKLAKAILSLEIAGQEDKTSALHQLYNEAMNQTDEIIDSISNLGYSISDVKTIEDELTKNGMCANPSLTKRMISRSNLHSTNDRLNVSLIDEYSIILYGLAREILQNEDLPETTKNSVISSVIDFIVKNSIAGRAMLCGNFDIAKILSIPELKGSKEFTNDKIEIISLGLKREIEQRIKDSLTLDSLFKNTSGLILSITVPDAIHIAALNIQRVKYGLTPMKPDKNENDFVVSAYSWASEKEKQFSNIKQKIYDKLKN